VKLWYGVALDDVRVYWNTTEPLSVEPAERVILQDLARMIIGATLP
jgi:hypothetical protein